MSNLENLINKIYQDIKDEVKDEWSVIEKIRFIYLKTGNYVEKNTDFFLNSKLDDLKLDDEEMYSIYHDNVINERDNGSSTKYQIICKSAAYLLKGIFEKFDIDSSFIITNGKQDEIRHWLLVAKDNDKQYFLTLAADLPFIKNSFPTRHFANGIHYFKTTPIKNEDDLDILNYDDYVVVIKGNDAFIISYDEYRNIKINSEGYRIIKLSGEFLNSYSGNIEFLSKIYEIPSDLKTQKRKRKIGDIEIEYDEIAHENLNAQAETLYEIDCNIGFDKLYETVDYINDKNYKELFYLLKEEDSIIYKLVRESIDMEVGGTKRIDEITENNVDRLHHSLNKYLSDFMNQYFNTSEYTEENFLTKYIENNGYGFETNEELISVLKKIKKDKKGTNEAEFISNLQSCLLLIKRFEDVVNLKEDIFLKENQLKEMITNYKALGKIDNDKLNEIYKVQYELYYLENKYKKAQDDLTFKELSPMLSRIAFFFVNNDVNEISTIKDDSKEYVTQKYIYEKFKLMMPYLFGWNNGPETSFSRQGYSEQVVIIKELLKVTYSELNPDNCSKIPHYNPKYSPIENRIRIFPMKNKQTGEYIIGFRFWAALDEDEVSLVYIPSQNKLCELDALLDRDKYITISSSNSLIDDLEDIEDKKDIAIHK